MVGGTAPRLLRHDAAPLCHRNAHRAVPEAQVRAEGEGGERKGGERREGKGGERKGEERKGGKGGEGLRGAWQRGIVSRGRTCRGFGSSRRRTVPALRPESCLAHAPAPPSLPGSFLRVGVVIMGLHDLCDVLMEASKLAKYTGRDGAATALFVSFAAAWAVLRLSFFPRTVLASTRHEIVRVLGGRPPCLGAFNAMLMALLVMHCYWFLLILRVAWRRIRAGEIQDSRED